VLEAVATAVRGGCGDYQQLEEEAMSELTAHGWLPDYVAIRRRADLQPPTLTPPNGEVEPLVILGAARLGTTRLIDNVEV
jgi:pantoate--beta-alanine ligase